MRGAALKLGQALSIQEDSLVPPHIREAFTNSRDFSYKMPRAQLQALLERELGTQWISAILPEFDFEPFAAASIGQVHKGAVNARLSESGEKLALSTDDSGQMGKNSFFVKKK